MKRNYTGKILLPLLLLLLALACKQKQDSATLTDDHVHSAASKYTCPMHPHIVQDKPGVCPICNMDLVPQSSTHEMVVDSNIIPMLKPVNERVVSNMPTIQAESGTRIFSVPIQGIVQFDTRKQISISSRVAGRIERMYIKYNYQPIRKGQLIMEIYSPDLAAAQRELIYISRNDDNAALLQKARQRLSLLGMQPAQIAQVLKSGNPLYRVPVYSNVSGYIVEKTLADVALASRSSSSTPTQAQGGMNGMEGSGSSSNSNPQQPSFNATPIVTREGQYVNAGETVFTVYQSNNMLAEFSFNPAIATEIKKGQKLVFNTTGTTNNVQTGSIYLVEPTLQGNSSFMVARVRLYNTNLQPGQLLTGNIPIVKSNAYWLPESAVLQLGTKAIVFKKEQTVFKPVEVQTGLRIEGMVQVTENILDWNLAKNASFLVDSESFIRLSTTNSK